jgi:hypothetical protein
MVVFSQLRAGFFGVFWPMETSKRSKKPALGATPTAHEPSPSSAGHTTDIRSRRPRRVVRKTKSKAAVIISPGEGSSPDVRLERP